MTLPQRPDPAPSHPPATPLAVVSLISGSVAVILAASSVIPWAGVWAAFAGVILAIDAVVLGHLALSRSRGSDGLGRTVAMTGLIVGYLALAVTLATAAFWLVPFLL